MRLRNIPGARDKIKESDFVFADPENMAGKWHGVFGNDNEIHIEIGMGKGRFILEMAKRHPNVNYIGIEKYSTVLLKALRKHSETDLQNIRFIRMDAEDITDVFAAGEIGKIYLNFSDPWPKDRHAKRRLPSRHFLEKYDMLLPDDGDVEFKTDNRTLFEFALDEARGAGWDIRVSTFDLHGDKLLCEGNVMTEYEEKFSKMGNPICKLIIARDNGDTRQGDNV